MSEIKIIATDKAPSAIGPYVQGKVVNGMLYASGQVAIDPSTGNMKGSTIEEQARQVLTNVKALVEAAGTDLSRVVKTTCFLKDIGDFAAFNAVYAEFFDKEPPARSCVGGLSLPKGALCEVEVIAAL